MSGLKWPHRVSPRLVESIVDNQVKIWALKQVDPVDQPRDDGQRNAGAESLPPAESKEVKADRLGFRYWGDVIASELLRLMRSDESSDAYLIEGLNEKPVPAKRRRKERKRD